MHQQKPNLVLGMAKDLTYEELRPFITSLRHTGFSGDIVFLYGERDESTHTGMELKTLQRLVLDGVHMVPFKQNFPYFSGTLQLEERWLKEDRLRDLHVFAYRILLYYGYLKRYSDSYKYVYITDTRDVIFQKDPFDFPLPSKLSVFMENDSVSIKDSKANTIWIKDTFGERALGEIGDKPVLCAGTLCMGSASMALQYMEVLMHLIATYGNPKTIDQGVHNYAVHKRLFPSIHIFNHDEGPVLNITVPYTFRLSNGKILNQHGDTPNIVHMYDRVIKTAWGRVSWSVFIKLIWKTGTRQWYAASRRSLATRVKKYS